MHKHQIEQRANIKFCFELGKTFTETLQLMNQVYGNDCLSRGRVHEWYTRFKNGRKDINDEQHVGPVKSVITADTIKTVHEFIKDHPEASLRSMEKQLRISKTSIHRILTEHLGLRKKNIEVEGSEKESCHTHPSDVLDMPVDPNEPTYCLCDQVSYGDMISCDNTDCPIEWFHFACVSLKTKPKGKWFCPLCTQNRKKKK